MKTAMSPVQEANFVFDFGEVFLLRTFALAEHLGFPCHSESTTPSARTHWIFLDVTSSRVHCNSGQVKTPKSAIWNSQNHHSYCHQWLIYSSDRCILSTKWVWTCIVEITIVSVSASHSLVSEKELEQHDFDEAVRQVKTNQSKNVILSIYDLYLSIIGYQGDNRYPFKKNDIIHLKVIYSHILINKDPILYVQYISFQCPKHEKFTDLPYTTQFTHHLLSGDAILLSTQLIIELP